MKKQPHIKKISLITLALLLIGVALWQTEQPNQTVWGKYYQPHADNRLLFLTSNQSFQQSFQPSFRNISGLLLELEEKDYSQNSNSIRITVTQGKKQSTNTAPLNQISATGQLLIPLEPLKTKPDQPLQFTVALVQNGEQVGLKFQPDSKKLSGGELHEIENTINKKRSGHLGFRPQYLATTRELIKLPLLIWLTLISTITLAIAILWYLQKSSHPIKKIKLPQLSRTDIIVGFTVAIYSGLFIWLHLLPANHLPINADMSKDMLYLQTSALAVKNTTAPYWHHPTCGGQPLLGNPETSVLSLGTPLALLFGSVIGLKLLLSLEVASAALGTYVLARLLGLKFMSATIPAIVIALGGFVVNRIFLGHTMFIGGIAFMPWFLITSYLAMRRHPYWSIIAASLMTLSFFRGDTHVIAYAIIAMFVISIITSIQTKKIIPLLIFGIIISLGAGFSMIKALPVLEGKDHFRGDSLPQLVAPLIEQEELLSVFLDDPEVRGNIDVVNGESEGWENIGIYTGPLIIALAIIGIFIAPRSLRLLLIPLLLTVIVLGEGSIYDTYLKHIPYLGQLLRLPSRLLLISVLAGAILGGSALDQLKKRAGKPIGLIVTTLLFLLVIADISLYAHRTLARMEFVPLSSTNSDTLLAVKANTKNPALHPITVAKSGSVAPRSCQDFNKQPPFNIKNTKPFATDQSGKPLLTSLSNNSIVIHPEQDSTNILAYTNDSPLLQINNGYVSPTNEQIGPLSIIPRGNPITLQYRSGTAVIGALLSTGFLLLALTTIRHNNFQHPKSKRKTDSTQTLH